MRSQQQGATKMNALTCYWPVGQSFWMTSFFVFRTISKTPKKTPKTEKPSLQFWSVFSKVLNKKNLFSHWKNLECLVALSHTLLQPLRMAWNIQKCINKGAYQHQSCTWTCSTNLSSLICNPNLSLSDQKWVFLASRSCPMSLLTVYPHNHHKQGVAFSVQLCWVGGGSQFKLDTPGMNRQLDRWHHRVTSRARQD